MTTVDTIVATATPAGRGGVAIVRISGPKVQRIAHHILKTLPPPRFAFYSPFLDLSGNAIDEGISLFFPAPNSFTGEDVLELQGHGGPAVVDCLIRCVISAGARLARPGEFSERAFLNNKIDLVQAEAIADLIDAASEQAARSALRSLQGEFSKKIYTMVEKLIHLRIYLEAAIDFVEEDINVLANEQTAKNLTALLDELERIQQTAKQGSLLREGVTLVIAGEPNVGKSSLLNQLSGKERAIVTDIPGTTRDVLREYILIDGMPLHIIDTAGLRESEDQVEQEGMRRAREEMRHADILVWMVNADSDDASLPIMQIRDQFSFQDKMAMMVIRNKIDLTEETPSITQLSDHSVISLSAKSGSGIDLLKNHIKKIVGFSGNNEGEFLARRRHLDALSRAKQFLISAQIQLVEYNACELVAEDLRQAQQALNEITGEFTSDDLLGRIFSSFCIGK